MKLFDSLRKSRNSGTVRHVPGVPHYGHAGRCGSARAKGFTLVEVIVVVVIVGILAAFAVPAFQEMIRRGQVTAATQDLLADLRIAKNEAVRQSVNTFLVENGGTWQVMANAVNEASGGTVLQQRQASGNVEIVLNPSVSIGFQPRGSATAAVTIRLSHNVAPGIKSCVMVSRAGNITTPPVDQIYAVCP